MTYRPVAKILPKPRGQEPEPVIEEKDERDQRRQTLYLPLGVHDQLRDVAHSMRISQQEVFRQALDMWFASKGLPSWKEAKELGDKK